MNAPKVSAVIPSWNRKDDLRECLDALLAQDCPSLEIVVVDNGSTDGTLEMLAERYQSVRVLKNSSNLGAATAKNQGIVASTGEYVWFLDSDAKVLSSSCLSVMVDILEKHPDIGSVGGEVFRQPDGAERIMRKTVCVNAETKTVIVDDPKPELLECDYLATCNCIVRKKDLVEIGGFDPDYFILSEDKEVGWRLKMRGLKSVIDHRTCALHGVSPRQRKGDLYRKHKNNIRFVLINFPLWKAPLLPLFDAAHLFETRKLKDIRNKQTSVMKHLDGSVKDLVAGDAPFVLKAVAVAVFYVSALIAAYAWNFWHLPKTLATRFHRPDFLERFRAQYR